MSLIAVSCLLVGVGLFGVMARRDIVGVLVAIEVMMAGALLLLVGLAIDPLESAGIANLARAQSFGLLVLVVAAAEAAVGLALAVAIARRYRVTRVDDMREGRG